MSIKDIFRKIDKKIFPENKLNYKNEEINMSRNIEILKKQLDELLNCSKVGEGIVENNSKDEEGLVISLGGTWGIGKTTFWSKYSEKRFQGDKNVYVSLFGKNSIEDVKKSILFELYTRNKILEKITGSTGSTKIAGIDVSSFANSLSKEDLKGKVICFDDFERISKNLDIREVMGYISKLKEKDKCKIIIINNNNLLEIQDRLNDKELSKKTKNNRDTKYFITETNNNEIFKNYNEKIIDYSLYYEPSVQDNFKLINKTLNEVFDKNIILILLENLSDDNKKYNIRLMKKLINNLNLFPLNKELKINDKILNSIIINIFLKVFDLDFKDISLDSQNIQQTNIGKIKKFLDNVTEKFYLDKEAFLFNLDSLNKEMTIDENEEELKSKINKIYNKYIYTMSFSDEEFVNEMYTVLKDNETIIIRLISLGTLDLYIIRLIELDSNNKQIYTKYFVDSFKFYIDQLFENESEIPYFVKDEYSNYLKKYPEIDGYFNKKLIEHKTESTTDINNVIKMMKEPRKNGGWNPEDEKTLSNISSEQHKNWILTDNKYFKTTLDFIIWINSYSGDRPFLNTYKSIINSYFLLFDDYKYKNRFIVTFKHLGIQETRCLEIIQILRNISLHDLKISFVEILQKNGINSGIIDRLFASKFKSDFLYEFEKILDEASTFDEDIREERKPIIVEFNTRFGFNFNFENDHIIIRDIVNNYKRYNSICIIE